MTGITDLDWLQLAQQDIWEHYKGCALCQTCPSWPSTVCPVMKRLRDGEGALMGRMFNELRQNEQTKTS